MLVDRFNRKLNYLRLSVTDLCNLRCQYCMPSTGVTKVNHQDILTYEEMLQLLTAATLEGVDKVRLTGGEPLIRKGIIDFVHRLSEIPGIEDLSLTTNGVLLAEMVSDLKAAGVNRLNISLDTLERETFKYITGRDALPQVLEGISSAIKAGFKRIKINTVIMRGINDHEISDLARLSMNDDIDVRFIEFMPLGKVDFWSMEKLITTEEIKEVLAPFGEMVPVEKKFGVGPADVFKLPGAKGRIGFISPISNHFCSYCNRLRITADGRLRLCLMSEQEFDLKRFLRQNTGLLDLRRHLREVVKFKPASHLLDQTVKPLNGRSMNRIGG